MLGTKGTVASENRYLHLVEHFSRPYLNLSLITQTVLAFLEKDFEVKNLFSRKQKEMYTLLRHKTGNLLSTIYYCLHQHFYHKTHHRQRHHQQQRMVNWEEVDSFS